MDIPKGTFSSILKDKSVIKTVAVLLLFPLVLVSVWSISYGFIAGYAGVLLISAGFVFLLGRPKWRYILAIVALWWLINLLFVVNTAHSFNETNDRYFARVKSGKELSTREKANVYVSNILMSALAYPFFPQVAHESLLMMFPVKDKVRYFDGDFFMKSNKIRRALKNYPDKKEIHIYWPASDYLDFFGEAGPALALNACDIRRLDNGRISAEVMVRYPYDSRTLLVPFPCKIFIQEGLFHYLETEGWLHLYKAVWISRE